MKETASTPNIRDLRSQFLRESKIFCNLLDRKSDEINADLKTKMLDEMRQKLKALLDIINKIETQDKGKAI
jgi:hypothetical protein